MLVLTRRIGEKIIAQIGDVAIAIMPVKAEGGWARIGIEAPREVLVLREELLTPEQKAALQSGARDQLEVEPNPID